MAAIINIPANENWVAHEFQYLNLNDRRLEQRCYKIVEDFAQQPDASIPKACGNWAKTKATYRFFANLRVEAPALIASHYQTTIERIGQQNIVLAVNDSSSMNYTSHPETTGLGTIGTKNDMGIMFHDTMAFTTDGVALGLIDFQYWTRPLEAFGKRYRRRQLSIEEKESYKWLKSYQAAVNVQKQVPQTIIIHIGDRESDVFELFELATAGNNRLELLIRAEHNRCIDDPEKYVWSFLAKQPPSGTYVVKVPRNKKQKERQAELTIRFAQVNLKSPTKRGKKHEKVLPIWAILLSEENPPLDVEPICWKLLTTLPVLSLEDAIEKIQWYMIRWQIELYHKVLKSGCRVEERQLRSVEQLIRCLMLDAVVAWRVLLLTKLGREVPDLPCTVVFDEYEWKALYCFVHKTQCLPEKEPNLQQAIRMVAKLGGFLARKSDGQPGSTTIWRGLIRLNDIVEAWRTLPPCPDNFHDP